MPGVCGRSSCPWPCCTAPLLRVLYHQILWWEPVINNSQAEGTCRISLVTLYLSEISSRIIADQTECSFGSCRSKNGNSKIEFSKDIKDGFHSVLAEILAKPKHFRKGKQCFVHSACSGDWVLHASPGHNLGCIGHARVGISIDRSILCVYKVS